MVDNRMPDAGVSTPPSVSTYNQRRRGRRTAFPGPTGQTPNFMPTMPQYEAGRRSLEDQYSAARMGLTNQQSLIAPQVNLQNARLDTNQTYDTSRVQGDMADRGLTLGSSPYDYLLQRDVQVPYGRNRQDLATWAEQQYADIASQFGATDLAYNQQMAELLLNNAADAASEMPMNVPQYSTGRRVVAPRNRRRRNGNG